MTPHPAINTEYSTMEELTHSVVGGHFPVPDWLPALFSAVCNGDVEVAEKMLQDNPLAHVDCRTRSDGHTPIFWAARRNQAEMVGWLLSKGAQLYVLGARNTLNDAILFKGLRSIQVDVEEAFQVNSGWTVLHEAAHYGSVEAARVILEADKDHDLVTAENHDHETALFQAVGGLASGERCVELLNLLVEHGADVTKAIGDNNWSLAHEASERNHPAAIRFLAEHGVDLSAPSNANGVPPLHRAAVHGQLEAVKELIAVGVDVNQRDMKGRTALMRACWPKRHAECVEAHRLFGDVVRALLAAGADPSLTDESNMSALECATRSGDFESFTALEEAFRRIASDKGEALTEAVGDVHLMFALEGGSFECLRRLAELRVELGWDGEDEEPELELVTAAVGGSPDCVEYVMSHTYDPFGILPAIVTASAKGKFDIVETILSNLPRDYEINATAYFETDDPEDSLSPAEALCRSLSTVQILVERFQPDFSRVVGDHRWTQSLRVAASR